MGVAALTTLCTEFAYLSGDRPTVWCPTERTLLGFDPAGALVETLPVTGPLAEVSGGLLWYATPYDEGSWLVTSNATEPVFRLWPTGRSAIERQGSSGELIAWFQDCRERRSETCASWMERREGVAAVAVLETDRGVLRVEGAARIVDATVSALWTLHFQGGDCEFRGTRWEGEPEHVPLHCGAGGGMTSWPCDATTRVDGFDIRCVGGDFWSVDAPWRGGEPAIARDLPEGKGWVAWVPDRLSGEPQPQQVAFRRWGKDGPKGPWLTMDVPSAPMVVARQLAAKIPCVLLVQLDHSTQLACYSDSKGGP